MKIETNTERFFAQKKLSEMKVEYHKRNLKSIFPFQEKYLAHQDKLKTVSGVIQLATSLLRMFNKKQA